MKKYQKLSINKKDNDSIKFISLKLLNLQSLKVKTKIVDILQSILSNEIEYNLLAKQIFEGIPDDILSLRPLIWKICLNYLSLKSNEWSNILSSNRSSYEKIKKQYIYNLSSDKIKNKNP